jgi:enoyl-CoA hydratase/carnithine racemase
VVDDGASLDATLGLAERLAALPRLAAMVAKQAIDCMPEASRQTGIALERVAYGLLARPTRRGSQPRDEPHADPPQ